MAEQKVPEPSLSPPEMKVRARTAHLPPVGSDDYLKLPAATRAKYEEHWYDWFDAVDWVLLLAMAGLMAVTSTGWQSGTEALLITFPGILVCFTGYYYVLKMFLHAILPPAGLEVVTKIAGALSTGLFGILIKNLFS